MTSLRRGRTAPALAALAGACVLAGCGSNSPSPSTTPPPTAAPTLPPGSDTYPAQDTPLDQAPAALAATWKPYGVSLIPGHSTVDPNAQWPRGLDAVGVAVMRTQVLSAWADEHLQAALQPHLMSTPFLLGATGVAVAEGTRVHHPPCSEYPTMVAAHAPDPSLAAALAKSGQNVGSGAVPVEMAFSGPCTVTGTTQDGQTVTVDTLPASRLVAMVEVRDDPVLGPVGHLDAAISCSDPAAARICAGA